MRLKTIAESIQKKSEIDALHIAVAEHRFQEEEYRADTESVSYTHLTLPTILRV